MPFTIERPVSPGVPGRAYVGPKAQTALEDIYHQYARAEARRRGVPISWIWRELLIEAAVARYGLKSGDE